MRNITEAQYDLLCRTCDALLKENSSSFEKSISYNNLSSKFELKQYEKVLISDLTDQIILDINDYLGVIK